MLIATLPPIELNRPPYYPSQTLGVGPEAARLAKLPKTIFEQYTMAQSNLTLKQKFLFASNTWKQNLMFSSLSHNLLSNRAYQDIIVMGKKALPFIYEDMKKNGPNDWFIALNIITGIDPVSPENRGYMEKMTLDWIRWIEDNGYVA